MNNPPQVVNLPVRDDPYASYRVPPGTAAAAEPALVPLPTQLDALQQDAQVPGSVPQWPEGAPELRPLFALPFDERADAMDRFAEAQDIYKTLEDREEGAPVQPREAAKLYRAYARLDAFLLSVAVDPEAYRRWVGRWDDKQFSDLWLAYNARMSPGEAKRSSS